ncbi:uncharacterized protein BXZ73DRAFT_104395 [Epithele typhae]|uniref:uncharacterized protein n=1 Tax=Epithele typhae TaxID=378194 RepID=UPI0020075B92|nr:uncharacterized protein BXZ73DRAFT_104395 [Epithele typhae]KAH9921506.1 hypothetical protein BXZ73DRAFT_104395 [Epithele typhae]
MIHLDHNHPASIPGPANPQNLALSSPHADQHRIPSWSSPSRDARPFLPDSQGHPFLTTPTPDPNPNPDTSADPAPDASADAPAPAPALDADEPPVPQQSSPDHPGGPSPPADSSSSLTPPPDATTPHRSMDAPEDQDVADKTSRQSTPLSDLSSPPETAPDENDTPNGAPESVASDAGVADAKYAAKDGASSPARAAFATVKPEPMSNHQRHAGEGPLVPKREPSLDGKAAKPDPKVVAILELNSLLLGVTMEMQMRGVTMTDATFHQYSSRLQSNLTWLAAAADETHKTNPLSASTPVLQPPPIVEHADMERIVKLYRELPTVFAKEIARRTAASETFNGNAKRERPDENVLDRQASIHKRRDTGESKHFATPGAGPSTPIPPSQPMLQMGNVAGMRMGSPSMPPPPVPSSVMSPPSNMNPGMNPGMNSGMAMPSLGDQPGMAMQNPGQNPMVQQFFQILNTPNHPFLQLLIQQIPNFQSLPMQEKLQKMHMAQHMIRQQRSASQGQGSGSMGNFPMQAVFPTRQRSSNDPRSMMTPQQQQMLQQMNPQQRQLFLLQQQ